MAMKKKSGGDSPLRQGAGKSFWTLPIFGSTAAADRDVFWKSDLVFRFFLSGGGGVANLWSGSISSSVFWKLREISGRLALVSSNSENISCVTFLKHKNSRKQGTGTVATC
jgi:hypothetical protein